MSNIRVGDKVKHQNLTCRVVSKEGEFLVLKPLGSSTVEYSARASDVTKIINEGSSSMESGNCNLYS